MGWVELVRPRTREQVIKRLLVLLSGGQAEVDPLNFPPTNYAPGDPLRTLMELQAEAVADVERQLNVLGRAAYLETAEGPFLTELVRSHYGLERQPAQFTRGLVRFYAPATGGVQVPPGMIVGTLSGLKYHSVQGAVIEPGGHADVEVRAESPGANYNAPVGTVTQLHTPLPGLSVTNPASWLIEAGADEESDASLRRRAQLRWAEMGGGATKAAYEYWALTAHPSVDRVRVLDEHPRGQGTADVVVWGTGGLGAGVVEAVNTYIQSRRPVTADIAVYSAAERVIDVPVQLYAPGVADRATIEAQVLLALEELQRAMPIGGRLYQAQVIEAAMLPPGMMDVRVGMPDLALDPTEAATLRPELSWRESP